MKQKSKEILEKELYFLYKVARTVTSLEIDEVLAELVHMTSEITHADSVLVYLIDEKQHALVLRASKNPHTNLLKKIGMKVGEGITGWVAEHKKPVVLEREAHKDLRFKLFSVLPEDAYEAFLSVPISTKKSVVGVINVQHKKPHAYTDMEVNLVTAMGKLVGGTVENALLIEETMELKEALAIRKLVDRAKGILMRSRNLTEEEAYIFMRKASMKKRTSIKEIAESILLFYSISN